jgi:hypothetical protein
MATYRADVTCLNCGRFLGEIEHAGGWLRLVRAGVGGAVPRLIEGRLRCSRCGGRALVDMSELTPSAA